ncbi:MAG: hypothetical protein H6851_17175 [Geminicoccaceae bacterium]|nr:hypothetical protein [Geminicoccaceae bacterium]MCB9945343.1 hypothetical protein [Geminicoccaceae bacterium]
MKTMSPATTALLLGLAGFAAAGEARAAGLNLELNKLEAIDQGCRIYMVIGNETGQELDSFQLDLVSFDSSGIIGERLAIELAPIAAAKTSVKLFDMTSACDAMSSLLINDVLACTSAGKPVEGCASNLTLSSKASTELRQ